MNRGNGGSLIFWACVGLWVIHWTSDAFPGGLVPIAFSLSFMILDLFGAFSTKQQPQEAEGEELNERQRQWREKLEMARRAEERRIAELEAEDNPEFKTVLTTFDDNGNEALVIIDSDGTVTTEGNPDPDIVQAAKMVRESVLRHGPAAVVEEIQKQLNEIEQAKK